MLLGKVRENEERMSPRSVHVGMRGKVVEGGSITWKVGNSIEHKVLDSGRRLHGKLDIASEASAKVGYSIRGICPSISGFRKEYLALNLAPTTATSEKGSDFQLSHCLISPEVYV